MKKAFSLVILCLLFLFAACTPNGSSIINATTDPSQYYTYENGDKYDVGAFAQTTEEIDSININWLSGSVELRGEENAAGITAKEDYRPKEGYEPYSLHTYLDKGTLYIKFMRYNLKISASNPTKKLTIIVPKSFEFKKITVTTVTATSEISDLTCLDFTQNSSGIGGALSTENCSYKTFSSHITAGDTVIKDCHFAEKTDFVMDTGSFIMESSDTVLLQGQCRTGDLILHDCDAKKADVNISLNGDGYMTDLMTEDFDLSCAAGSIYAHLSEQMTDYKLDCKSPFTVVYPENIPEDGKKPIRLHSTAGRIKFLPKQDILDILTPEEKKK